MQVYILPNYLLTNFIHQNKNIIKVYAMIHLFKFLSVDFEFHLLDRNIVQSGEQIKQKKYFSKSK